MTSRRRLDLRRTAAPAVRRLPRDGHQGRRSAPLPDFHTPVRGHAFAARPPGAPEPSPGDPVAFVREPGNPADPRAVAVWVDDAEARWRIGYLDRVVAARLAPRLDAGASLRAVLVGWTSAPGGWRRPLVQVTVETGHDELPTDGLFGRPPGSARRTVPGADGRGRTARDELAQPVPRSTMPFCGR